jgi:hypothetical protein
MEENEARQVTDALRAKGVNAQMARPGVMQFGVRVMLPDGREAIWDADGTAGLEANVLRNGQLVGFVPVIEGSENFTLEETVEAIWHTDYDKPIAVRRTTPPPAAAPLPPQGGVFRRFFDGFRYR